jgi:hypothetical protein
MSLQGPQELLSTSFAFQRLATVPAHLQRLLSYDSKARIPAEFVNTLFSMGFIIHLQVQETPDRASNNSLTKISTPSNGFGSTEVLMMKAGERLCIASRHRPMLSLLCLRIQERLGGQ